MVSRFASPLTFGYSVHGTGEWLCPGGRPGLQNQWPVAPSERRWVRLPSTPAFYRNVRIGAWNLKIAGRGQCWRLFAFYPVILLIAYYFWTAPHVAAQGSDNVIYLPLSAGTTIDCNLPGASYDTLAPKGESTDRPAASHPDINLAIRGWSATSADLSLFHYDGPTDLDAPQLDSLFALDRLPQFSSAYRVHHWDWDCDCRSEPTADWDVTLLGVAASGRESLHVPQSGYEIGGGFEVLVLYATHNRLTLKYTVEDDVKVGYTLHLEDICVEPDLLNLYEQMNAEGRERLPALREGQAFGRAVGNQFRVAIRDNGSFLDPRSQKDWWKDYSVP